MSGWLATLAFTLAAGTHSLWNRPPELAVAERVPVTEFGELKAIAFQYLGRPYVMGGIGDPGVDCSGFTCRVFAEAGYALPRVSRDQARAGIEVPLDRLAAGDLLFFTDSPGGMRITHVGMYLGGTAMIHASSGEGEVVLADLSRGWYRDRLVAARRVLQTALTATGTTTAPILEEPRLLETVEHTGQDVLPITRRLPRRAVPPSTGPGQIGERATSLALRTLALTEDGVLGLTLAPEATLFVQDWALLISIAVPIRFEVGEEPTAGELDDPGDWTRFLRAASVGLRGAELEIRLDRLGDMTLGGGFVLERLAPGNGSSGVPGLSVGRTPLSMYGSFRGPVSLQLLVDDVTRPGVFGGSGGYAGSALELGLAYASDQRGGTPERRRAINEIEAFARYHAYEDRHWTVTAEASAAVASALGRFGAGGRLGLFAQHRYGRSGGSSVSARLFAAALGSGKLDATFGPTYFAARPEHILAIHEAGTRAELGGELLLRFGKLAFGAGYADALGDGRDLLDRRLFGLAEIEGIAIGAERLLDLRVAYSARGVPGPREAGASDVLHGGARLRITSWLAAELYVEESDRLEGGGGVTVAWTP